MVLIVSGFYCSGRTQKQLLECLGSGEKKALHLERYEERGGEIKAQRVLKSKAFMNSSFFIQNLLSVRL